MLVVGSTISLIQFSAVALMALFWCENSERRTQRLRDPNQRVEVPLQLNRYWQVTSFNFWNNVVWKTHKKWATQDAKTDKRFATLLVLWKADCIRVGNLCEVEDSSLLCPNSTAGGIYRILGHLLYTGKLEWHEFVLGERRRVFTSGNINTRSGLNGWRGW